MREKDSELEEMRCEIEALEERVGKQEQYSSKHTIIMDNLPIYDLNLPLLGNMLKFFECFLDYRLQIGDKKACQLLPKTKKTIHAVSDCQTCIFPPQDRQLQQSHGFVPSQHATSEEQKPKVCERTACKKRSESENLCR